MKQNILGKKWNSGKEISIGSTGSLPSILFLLYYWIMVAYYFINPINAYDINMKIEKHAYETYVKYSRHDHPDG